MNDVEHGVGHAVSTPEKPRGNVVDDDDAYQIYEEEHSAAGAGGEDASGLSPAKSAAWPNSESLTKRFKRVVEAMYKQTPHAAGVGGGPSPSHLMMASVVAASGMVGGAPGEGAGGTTSAWSKRDKSQLVKLLMNFGLPRLPPAPAEAMGAPDWARLKALGGLVRSRCSQRHVHRLHLSTPDHSRGPFGPSACSLEGALVGGVWS